MTIFILITAMFFCLLLLLNIANKEKAADYIQWGLGVDSCSYYSPPLTVTNQSITIVGFQEALEKYSTIRYSVIKMNWMGKRTVYGQGFICGNYKEPNYFSLTIEDIPNGEDYKIEVFNNFQLSYGRFKITG